MFIAGIASPEALLSLEMHGLCPSIWPNHVDQRLDRAILHDKSVYGQDVDVFNPERFLHPDGSLNESVPFPQAVFGYGRRACPGQDLAGATMWMAIVSILAAFDITNAVDEHSKTIEKGKEFTSALVS